MYTTRKNIIITKAKALLCGRHVKFSFYEKELFYNTISASRKKIQRERQEKNETDKEDNRKRAGNRARGHVFNIISTNAWFWKDQKGIAYNPKFLTLTFGENISNVEEANLLHTKFIKKFNYKIFQKKKIELKYVSVIEFQKRGAIHYHMVLFNIPYILSESVFKVWGHGYIKIKKVDEQKNVARYLTKYMSKNNMDERLNGKKRYFCSRGLLKPVEIKREFDVFELYQKIPKEYLSSEIAYVSKYLGVVKVISYDLGKGNTINDIIG